MNNRKLFTTQKKLTALFTLLIFGIISVFGVLFFTGKYINTQRNEKFQFLQSTQMLINEFEKNPENFSKIFLPLPPEIKANPRYKNMIPRRNQIFRELDFMIFDNQNILVMQNIRNEISQDFFDKILSSHGILQEGNVIARSVQTSQNTFVFFQKQMYSSQEFIEEVMVFLLFNIIFTFLFACIGWIFVKKILSPVEQNISDMNDFVHNAGHELKTPLAVMSSNLQLLFTLKQHDEELIKNSIDEIKKMDTLIDGLSQLSDIQAFSHQERVNLASRIESILGDFGTEIQKKELKIIKNIDSEVIISTSPTYFDILIRNLLTNAIKYNHQKGTIEMILTKKIFKIRNTGSLIPASKYEQIFDRFYRLDTSRSTPGFGIGLSLVKKICEIQKWKISLKEFEKKNEFIIEFRKKL